MIKTILLVIGVIIVIMLIIPAFMGNDFHISREVTVNKPNAEVFDYIKHLKNQDQYSKWVMQDPNMKKEFRGTDGTKGFVYGWDSKDKSGKGEQEIKDIVDGRRVDIELRFEKPFASVAQSPMSTEPISGNQTKVKWEYQIKANYLMNVMRMYAGLDKMLGKDMEGSLNRLKTNVEQQQPVAETAK